MISKLSRKQNIQIFSDSVIFTQLTMLHIVLLISSSSSGPALHKLSKCAQIKRFPLCVDMFVFLCFLFIPKPTQRTVFISCSSYINVMSMLLQHGNDFKAAPVISLASIKVPFCSVKRQQNYITLFLQVSVIYVISSFFL